MQLLKKVSETVGPYLTVGERTQFANHTVYNSVCPTSTHRKKWHEGRATHRATVTTKWSNGNTSTSYIDTCICKHCGHEWNQEFCFAF